MKKVVKLSLLALASLAVVGCVGDSDLADRMSALEEKVEKGVFYAEKDHYAFEDEITIYYNGEKLYSLSRFHEPVMHKNYGEISVGFFVTAYENYIIPANIYSSFFLEWDKGLMLNLSPSTSDRHVQGIMNSEVRVGIGWTVSSSIFDSIKSSPYQNLLITIPGTTIPVTRIELTNFTYS